MKNGLLIYFIVLFIMHSSITSEAKVFYVNSQVEFTNAHNSALMNDSIIWESGVYTDIYMDISKPQLHIRAETIGKTVFTGASYVKITADHITLSGVQFVDGDIGTKDVINTAGSYNHFHQINIRSYISYKYLVIREACQYVQVTYCNFENRLNLDDKNILSILVDDINPGYHKVQHCSFKNFDGTGNDLGIEPIRIGLSTQADHISRSLVEYCYFTQCNGDGEIISSKASQNVYRFNTFENNPKAELVLRHGSEAIVYGNFFINGKGGVRVREGQHHYIYNNYFYEIDDRAIYLQNNSSDPLEDINIAFNTVVDCSEVILGSDGSFNPKNVTLANNIFADPDDDLFEDATGTETWIGNIAHGSLGISLPNSGISQLDPQLQANNEGFFGLNPTSPAIDAAETGYTLLPQFPGMAAIDSDVLFDLMGQARPALVNEKDLGCNEYPHTILIQPIATEVNTGPSYNTSTISGIFSVSIIVDDLFDIFPNPVFEDAVITLDNDLHARVTIDLINVNGTKLQTLFNEKVVPGDQRISYKLQNLPSGIYIIRAARILNGGRRKEIQVERIIVF